MFCTKVSPAPSPGSFDSWEEAVRQYSISKARTYIGWKTCTSARLWRWNLKGKNSRVFSHLSPTLSSLSTLALSAPAKPPCSNFLLLTLPLTYYLRRSNSSFWRGGKVGVESKIIAKGKALSRPGSAGQYSYIFLFLSYPHSLLVSSISPSPNPFSKRFIEKNGSLTWSSIQQTPS